MTAVFWMLVLAHLIGDYPLQTDWLVSVKRNWWGLSLHVGVHLLVLLILAGSALPSLWPYLVTLAVIHYCIDAFKNWLSSVRPQWVNGPYIFDQFLHLLSLIGITLWIANRLDPSALASRLFLSPEWTILLIGLSLCSVVWYISERVLSHATPVYQQEVVDRRWPRIFIRATLFFLLLWAGELAGALVLPLFLFLLPYPSPTYRRRAMMTDVAVALVSALLVMAAQ